ncbi:hypothetical protein ILUMI_07918 [Ignelater luminosus]|uniref:Reverse transcriptase n=1 Tax=Ignelater luminosus TaxID=2038154 RepID=A0A8K0DCE5_IGNLU|nr:hypothetical protein ILUMI_07918 [Ignelater luminosus]
MYDAGTIHNAIEEIDRRSVDIMSKVKRAAGIYKPRKPGCITDNQESLVVDKEHIQVVWKKYVERTFEDGRDNNQLNLECSTGRPITHEKVKTAIKATKAGKAAGPDNFQPEFMKIIGDEGTKSLTAIFDKVYNSGRIPLGWLKQCEKYEDHYIISLISHLLKTFLKIIRRRIYQKCEAHTTQKIFVHSSGLSSTLQKRQLLY